MSYNEPDPLLTPFFTDPLNRGTYNFYNPKTDGADEIFKDLLWSDKLHIKYDYDIYIDQGNDPLRDSTNYWDRWNRKFLLPTTLIE